MNNRLEADDYMAIATFIVCAIALVLGLYFGILPAKANDDGQWGNADPMIAQWYRDLKQPDNPEASCCGEADAYWCDDIHVRDGHTFCGITDDRPDEPRHRPHLAIGTTIEIPDNKLKWDRGNPTGHAIVFIGRPGYMSGVEVNGTVFCFVQGGGT